MTVGGGWGGELIGAAINAGIQRAVGMQGGGPVPEPPPFIIEPQGPPPGPNAPSPAQPPAVHVGTGLAPGPDVGLGAVPGPGGGPTPIGGVGFPQGMGSGAGAGGQGLGNTGITGGIAKAGIGAGAMALDALAPGAGTAASIAVNIAIQEITRAIGFGAQAASIGVQGLMETFLPFGASNLASNSWLTRIGGAIAGAGVSLPNVAGKLTEAAQQVPAPPPLTTGPEGKLGGQMPQPVNVNVNVDNTRVPDIQSDVAHHQVQAWPAQSGSR